VRWQEYQKFISGQMQEGAKEAKTDKEKKAQAANPDVWRVARTTGELGRKVPPPSPAGQRVSLMTRWRLRLSC